MNIVTVLMGEPLYQHRLDSSNERITVAVIFQFVCTRLDVVFCVLVRYLGLSRQCYRTDIMLKAKFCSFVISFGSAD
jgi:hypothetical protein